MLYSSQSCCTWPTKKIHQAPMYRNRSHILSSGLSIACGHSVDGEPKFPPQRRCRPPALAGEACSSSGRSWFRQHGAGTSSTGRHARRRCCLGWQLDIVHDFRSDQGSHMDRSIRGRACWHHGAGCGLKLDLLAGIPHKCGIAEIASKACCGCPGCAVGHHGVGLELFQTISRPGPRCDCVDVQGHHQDQLALFQTLECGGNGFHQLQGVH